MGPKIMTHENIETVRSMKSINVRTSPVELDAYQKQFKKELRSLRRETDVKPSFSSWVRWKLLRPL